jgi:hypothetical protein
MSFTALTWLHSEKAVALAVQAYGQRYPEAPIYDVRVSPLGAAAKSATGTVEVGSDLLDRYEF